jgi:hypothetical protein
MEVTGGATNRIKSESTSLYTTSVYRASRTDPRQLEGVKSQLKPETDADNKHRIFIIRVHLCLSVAPHSLPACVSNFASPPRITDSLENRTSPQFRTVQASLL